MKFKKFQKKFKCVEIPNFLDIFKNQNIYVGGCGSILQKYKKDLKQLCKRSIIHYYLTDKSAVPIDLMFKLSKKHPEIVNECFENSLTFASRANKGHKLPKKINWEISYLIGCLRDGHLDENGNSIVITQKGENGKKWLEFLGEIFQRDFGLKPKIINFKKIENIFELKTTSKPLALYFKEIFDMPKNQKVWNTPKIILDNKELWNGYVSGFFDAEGYCTKPKTFRKTGKKKISFHQNNINSLNFIKNALNDFGIETSKIYLQKGRECYALYVQSKSGIVKFNDIFNPVMKKKNLNDICSLL